MRLIVGVGNPGEKYRNNRHNVGFIVVDEISKTPRIKNSKQVKIFKSKNFMNESGIFARKLVEQYKVNTADLWIIHDDLDIKLGYYKIQKGRGPKDHNGILSIEKELGSKDFWRVRVGIENRKTILNSKLQIMNERKTPGDAYVLQDFTKEEKGIIDGVIRKVVKELIRRIMNNEP